jgi:hypothetical protein
MLRPFGAVHGSYALPRTVDIAAALNRLRTLRITRMISKSEDDRLK